MAVIIEEFEVLPGDSATTPAPAAGAGHGQEPKAPAPPPAPSALEDLLRHQARRQGRLRAH